MSKNSNSAVGADVVKARILVATTIGGVDYKANDLLKADKDTVAGAVAAGHADDNAAAVAYVEQLLGGSSDVLE